MAKPKFAFHQRTYEDTQERATQRGGSFDSWIKQGVTVFKAKEGLNTIRFIPIPMEIGERLGTRHYAIDAYVHYNIGGNNSYLCREAMLKQRCPVCDYRRQLEAEHADKEEIKELNPRKAVCAWVIDRDDEKAGPKLWPMSYTMDKKFAQLSMDEQDKTLLVIEDPDEGYDCSFHRAGTTVTNTKYTAEKIARKASYLARSQDEQDDILKFVSDNPIDACMVYVSEEDIEASLNGRAAAEPADTRGDTTEGRLRDRVAAREANGHDRDERGREPADERPAPRGRGRDSEPANERPAPRGRTRAAEADPEPEEPKTMIDDDGNLCDEETGEILKTAEELEREAAAREPAEPRRGRAEGREAREPAEPRGEPRRGAGRVADDPPPERTRGAARERPERPARGEAAAEPETTERRRPAASTTQARGRLANLRR